MTSQRLGLLIGSAFGLAFVAVNAGALPTGIGIVVGVIGGIAFLLVLIGIRRVRADASTEVAGQPAAGPTDAGPTDGRPVIEGGRTAEDGQPVGIRFGRGYWVVVVAEVVAIVAGVRLIAGPLNTPDAGVAWVALVVGVHFVALAAVWAEPIFGWLGGSIAACAVAGLILGFADASKSAVATVGGILPGALLLGFALCATPRAAGPAHPVARG